MFNHINFESINRGLNYCIDWSQLIRELVEGSHIQKT